MDHGRPPLHWGEYEGSQAETGPGQSDGISSAAGVIAVASIAIQLVDSINKLATFWNNVKDAPEDIRSISIDLELLASVLTEIALEAQHIEPDASLVAVLRNCQLKVRTLTGILNGIERGFAAKNTALRRWTALKAVFQSEKLEKFQDVLERLKSTLILAQQKQHSRLIRHGFQVQRQDLIVIREHMSPSTAGHPFERCSAMTATSPKAQDSFNAENEVVRKDPTAISRRSLWNRKTVALDNLLIKSAFGTITGNWRQVILQPTNVDDQDSLEQETIYSYAIVPAAWLRSIGLNYTFQLGFSTSSSTGWQQSLQAARIVPDDALIFIFCRQGNLDGVRTLLSLGRASVRDVDSRGNTPLVYAAEWHRADVCKYLISHGADRCVMPPSLFESPFYLALMPRHKSESPFHIIDTLRHFVDLVDYSEDLGRNSGWDILMILTCGDLEYSISRIEILHWILRISASDIKESCTSDSCAWLLYCALALPQIYEVLNCILGVCPANAINVARAPGGYTALHYAINSRRSSIIPLLAKNLDLHTTGYNERYSSKPESPTSLALHSVWAFSRWFGALLETGTEMNGFIYQETEEGPISDAGWKESTLRLLFDSDIQDIMYDFGLGKMHDRNDLCGDCGNFLAITAVKVQPFWFTMVKEVRRGTPPKVWLEAEKSRRRATKWEAVFADIMQRRNPEDVSDDQETRWVPKESTMESDIDPCPYEVEDVVCMDCCLYFERYGQRFREVVSELSSDEDDYSPFHIHT